MGILTDSDRDLELFFEMALDHLVVAGFDGYFKRLSGAWTSTLGWTQEEFLARPVIEFVHPDDRAGVLEGRAGLVAGVPLLGLVNRYQHKDGSYRWFEWRSVGYPERKLVYAVAREVTLRKQAEEERERARAQLIVSERMASLGRLAAGVAHEINNPLAYVMSNLRSALDTLQSPTPSAGDAAEMREMLVDALHGADRVRQVVSGLQSLAATEIEHRARVQPRTAVELALAVVGSELRQRARLVQLYRQTPWVQADEGRLAQALVNLLLNAAAAIPPGDPAGHEVRVATFTDAQGRAVIEVEDSGTGIPPEVLGRIFDPFFTTRPVGKGAGLGLSIAHSLVTAVGGQIEASHGEERGAVFRVTLPACA